jgi:ABC-type transporter Mla subunit MlaD
MTSLHETLPILESAVPAIAPKVAAVGQDAEAFQQAVRDLLENVEEKEGQARELLTRVQAALDAVHDGAEQMNRSLGESLEAAEGAVDEALKALADGRGELRAALQSAGGAMDDLKTNVQDGGGRMEGAQKDAGQALDQLGPAIETERGELDGAIESVEAAVDAVEQALGQGRTTLTEAADELGTTLASLLGEVRERIAQAQTRLTSDKDVHDEALSEVVLDTTTRSEALARTLSEQVQAEVREVLTATMAEVSAGLGLLSEAVAQAEEGCRSAHEQLEEHFTELLARIPPLSTGVDQVRQAAATAGVAWPG